jgi:hypothetical protein
MLARTSRKCTSVSLPAEGKDDDIRVVENEDGGT